MSDKQATKKERKELLDRVDQVLSEFQATGEAVDFKLVANKLGVARSTLYRNTIVRQKIIAAREKHRVPSDILTLLQENIYRLENKTLDLERRVEKLESRCKD